MARALKVQLSAPRPDFVHSFRNFGEDVYRALRTECEISIKEIDSSASEFHLRGIHKHDIRSITAKVRKIIEKHRYPLPPIEVQEIADAQDA